MTEFLSEENTCGQTLLKIVARGSSILAEMQRLASCIPKIFIHTDDPKYQKVILDFRYYKNIDQYEDEIQSNMDLLDINENLKLTYMPLIERFYVLFESIFLYYSDLIEFTNQVRTGVYIQYTFDNILEIVEGKQLVAEAFYLYGVMLLLMDHIIIGPVREKMVVAYYRNNGGENISNIKQVRRLATDTEFRPATKGTPLVKPQNYPDDLFERFPIEAELMQQIIIAVKDDDIYRQLAAYPLPALRSFALANQSAILFILLFFVPQVLVKAKSPMRQIVDKHFYNNWVIPYYLGYIVDLTLWWNPYKAAKMALGNILDLESIQDLIKQFVNKQMDSYQRCRQFLVEGLMTEEFVLNKLNSLMNCLRDCNITVRWLMLHRKTTHEKLRQMMMEATNASDILKLLLTCSQFQNNLKNMCSSLIDKKQEIWDADKANSKQRMDELSEYFGGARALGKIQADEGFRDWFNDMSEAIDSLSFNDETFAGRKIQKLLKALEDIEEYEQISMNIQIKQYLADTRNDLKHMVKVVNMRRAILTHIDIITDFTWSWVALKDYIRLMQQEVKANPGSALLLKNTFTKLSSILNTPMVRVVQSESPDVVSVSKYYSNQLIKLVKDVLQIIPGSVFETLASIVNLLTNNFKMFPQKFDKAQLSKYSQFEDRKQLAHLTHQISVFAESVLNMESYLVGVIEVNPKQILEAGIKKELIKLIAKVLDEQLVFPLHNLQDFEKRLKNLGSRIDGLKTSLEYIQDFIRSYGLKIFYEEYERLIGCYIDMEKTSFITKKIGYEQLNYDDDIPMPPASDGNCNNFMGRVLLEIIQLTDYKKCVFLSNTYAFYEYGTGREVFTIKTLGMLYKCIGISGLQGLDHLLGVLIMTHLNALIKQIEKECDEKTRKILISSYNNLKHFNSFNQRYQQVIYNVKGALKGLNHTIMPVIMKIGQFVLLRDMICLQLQMLSKVGSNRLFLVLQNVNKTILNDIINREYTDDMLNDQRIQSESCLLYFISHFCNFLGMTQASRKIYITVKPIEFLPLILFALVSMNINSMDFDKKIKSLMRKNPKDPFEPNYFIYGLIVILNQFHPTNKEVFLGYISHYIKSTMNFIMINKEVSKNPQIISDLFLEIVFFEEFVKFAKEPYGRSKKILDVGIFSELNKQTLKSSSHN